MDAYGRFAPYYDAVYGERVDYAGDVAFLREAFDRHARVPVRRLLDLGAGTGNHAIPLARAGYDVTALDLSEPLVDILRSKALAAGVQVRANVGDMARDVPAGAYDAAVCMFGAWCYLHSDEESGALLDQLRDRLPSGGVFVFEFWSPLGWAPSVRVEEYALKGGRRLIRLTKPDYDLERDVYVFTTEHLVMREDECTDHFVERHGLRLRTPMQTRGLLRAHGFEVAAFTPGAPQGKNFGVPAINEFRVMCIARKT